MDRLELKPGETTLAQLAEVYWHGRRAVLDPACEPAVSAAAGLVGDAAAGETAIYGVNTGFGKLASIRIDSADTETLQRNLILSHCSGVGEPVPSRLVRLMITLKLLSFGRGASGVSWQLAQALQALLTHDIMPQVPSQGSVGASGDLAPLSHMSAALIGEGQVVYRQQIMPAAEALQLAGLSPMTLGPKEGLALINGTQFSTSFALAGLFEAWRALNHSLVISAMSTDAIMGSTAPLRPGIHALRGHQGQIDAAALMRELLAGSRIRDSHKSGDTRVQDPYCIRCQPQVAGAAMDILRQSATTLEIEANAATDNPLVLVEDDLIASGGNFHAEPVGFAADMIALALSEIGSIAQRRVALMVDPTLSFDLPAFLTPDPGLNSGMMVAEITSAALMSENRHLANPCVTDSTPTSANQEDHVSMAAHGARRLVSMTQNLHRILGIELVCAAQGIEFRAPLTTSEPLQRVIEVVRGHVRTLEQDRALSEDLETAAALIAGESLLDALKMELPVLSGRFPD